GIKVAATHATPRTQLVIDESPVTTYRAEPPDQLLGFLPAQLMAPLHLAQAYLIDGVRRSNTVELWVGPPLITGLNPSSIPPLDDSKAQLSTGQAMAIRCDRATHGTTVVFDSSPLQ